MTQEQTAAIEAAQREVARAKVGVEIADRMRYEATLMWKEATISLEIAELKLEQAQQVP